MWLLAWTTLTHAVPPLLRRVLYVVLSFGVLLAAIGGSVALYFVPPKCSLNTFFVSQTIALGMCYTVLAAAEKVGKGLLPPAIMFA